MSHKSRSVGDIVPLNRGQLMTDLDLMQKQISDLKLKVSDLGDVHSQQISSKTDEIEEKLHTLLYFVLGMRESLFQRHQCNATDVDVGLPLQCDVLSVRFAG